MIIFTVRTHGPYVPLCGPSVIFMVSASGRSAISH